MVDINGNPFTRLTSIFGDTGWVSGMVAHNGWATGSAGNYADASWAITVPSLNFYNKSTASSCTANWPMN